MKNKNTYGAIATVFAFGMTISAFAGTLVVHIGVAAVYEAVLTILNTLFVQLECLAHLTRFGAGRPAAAASAITHIAVIDFQIIF